MRIELTLKVKDIVRVLDSMAELPSGLDVRSIKDLHAYSHEAVYSEDAFRDEITIVITDHPLDIGGMPIRDQWQCYWKDMGYVPCTATNQVHDKRFCPRKL